MGGASGSPTVTRESPEAPRGRQTMHEKLEERTGHRTRAKRCGLALLWSAGVLLLAFGTAVMFVAVWLIESGGG